MTKKFAKNNKLFLKYREKTDDHSLTIFKGSVLCMSLKDGFNLCMYIDYKMRSSKSVEQQSISLLQK
jgi:hypothetical protein